MRQNIVRCGLAVGGWIFMSFFKGVIKVALESGACGACGLVKVP
jgi:hypothetical protein